MMTVVCAWCGIVLREHESVAKDLISHGICPDCEEKVHANVEARRQEHLVVPAHFPRQVDGAVS